MTDRWQIVVDHPVWCDAARCNAAAVADTVAANGEHRSASVELSLTAATEFSADRAVALLSLAAVPWPCETYLRLGSADLRLWLSVDAADPVSRVVGRSVGTVRSVGAVRRAEGEVGR
jgi:hypothetical protein